MMAFEFYQTSIPLSYLGILLLHLLHLTERTLLLWEGIIVSWTGGNRRHGESALPRALIIGYQLGYQLSWSQIKTFRGSRACHISARGLHYQVKGRGVYLERGNLQGNLRDITQSISIAYTLLGQTARNLHYRSMQTKYENNFFSPSR